MRCENVFCIYWDKNCCCLDEISLDSQGSCESCIYVEIEEDVLAPKRMRCERVNNRTQQTKKKPS